MLYVTIRSTFSHT